MEASASLESLHYDGSFEERDREGRHHDQACDNEGHDKEEQQQVESTWSSLKPIMRYRVRMASIGEGMVGRS